MESALEDGQQQDRGAHPLMKSENAMPVPTRISVVVRVRPKLPSESAHSTEILRVLQQRNMVHCSASNSAKSFQFDQVFDGETTQRSFYDQLGVDRMLRAVLDGYHATVFAYGQTGSGKTFTMEGYDYERARDPMPQSERGPLPQAKFDSSTSGDRVGLIPRAIFTLFELMARATRDSSREFVVKCSFLQIYNEHILDLFNPSHFLQLSRKSNVSTVQGGGARAAAASKQGMMQGLRLRWSAVRDFYVENLRVLECTSPEHVLQYFQDGIKHKVMASHNLNAASSRSHCIFTIYVESFDPVHNPNEVLQSKLALVDLAGSERVDKTGATGMTLQESIGINKSLFVLRQVIQALSEEGNSTKTNQGPSKERNYIPYRDSKLTSLLKYSLGGNSWTLMIACLSPSDSYLDENLSTLTYAAKAQSIANNPTKNEDPKTILINELRQEIDSLRRQLAQAQDIILQFQQLSTNEQTVGGEGVATPNRPNNPVVFAGIEPLKQMPLPVASTTNPQVLDSSTSTKLKMRVIDNVEMIKQLYATEKQLSERTKHQETRISDLQHETRVLHVENQSLREKMEVLEYLLATQSTEDHTEQNSSQDPVVEEIPGYGALTKTASGRSLPAIPPSADRIKEALSRKSSSSRQGKQPISENNNQEPSRPSRLPNRKIPKRQEAETGLLSLAELRDLLGGKKLGASVDVTPSSNSRSMQNRNGPPRPSTNPPPVPPPQAPPIQRPENPTASILAMLQQQKLETGQSTLEKDPLDSLSELNRLLRVKATLRRSSSFK